MRRQGTPSVHNKTTAVFMHNSAAGTVYLEHGTIAKW